MPLETATFSGVGFVTFHDTNSALDTFNSNYSYGQDNEGNRSFEILSMQHTQILEPHVYEMCMWAFKPANQLPSDWNEREVMIQKIMTDIVDSIERMESGWGGLGAILMKYPLDSGDEDVIFLVTVGGSY